MTRAMKSGHCAFPQSEHPEASHERCAARGAGEKSPSVGFMPCPCWCHLDTEEYECGNCERPVRLAPHWPVDMAEPDEPVYVHVDVKTGDAIGEECA